MSGKDSYNYRAVNRDTGEKCPHKHHSRDHALDCADHYEWSNIMTERFDTKKEWGFKHRPSHIKRTISLEDAFMWGSMYYEYRGE